MDSNRRVAASSATPLTSKSADLLLGLKEGEDDQIVFTATPTHFAQPAQPTISIADDPVENCNCRKSRCLKL